MVVPLTQSTQKQLTGKKSNPPKNWNPQKMEQKAETLWSRLVLPTGTKGFPTGAPCVDYVEAHPSRFLIPTGTKGFPTGAPCVAYVEAHPSRFVRNRDESPPL